MSPRTLALVAALALAAGPSAAATQKPKGARSAAKPAKPPAAKPAAAEPATPPAPVVPPTTTGGMEREVAGFVAGVPTAGKDGGVKLDWSGPGGAQLKMSWDLLERRNEQIAIGDMMVQSLMQVVERFYASGGAEAAAVRARLEGLSGSMEEARTSYQAAVDLEGKRLFYVEKAVAAATEAGDALPGVDPELVAKRAAAIKEGRLQKVCDQRLAGYRALALGLMSYIDSDALPALEKMKVAGEALPDVAVVHAYLGSLYYLFQQSDAATAAWKRAADLDPSNETVRTALKEYGRKGR